MSFTEGNIKEALKDLSPRKYADLAEKFGFSVTCVEKLQTTWLKDHNRVLMELIKNWISTDVSASWDTLRGILDRMGLEDIAVGIPSSSQDPTVEIERQSIGQEKGMQFVNLMNHRLSIKMHNTHCHYLFILVHNVAYHLFSHIIANPDIFIAPYFAVGS